MKRSILLMALSLVLVLMMDACSKGEGGGSDGGSVSGKEQDAKLPQLPTQFTEQTPENFVGTWIAMFSEDTITITADGKAEINGTPVRIRDDAKNEVMMLLYEDWVKIEDSKYAQFKDENGNGYIFEAGIVNYRGGFLYCNFEANPRFPAGVFYKQGSPNPAEVFYGTWISAFDPEEKLILSNKGESTFKGQKITAEVNTGDIRFLHYGVGNEDRYSVRLDEEKYLISQGEGRALYYREGTDNPLEPFRGTWTRTSEEDQSWKGAPVTEVTITDDYNLTVNGESIPLSFDLRIEQDASYWHFNGENGKVNGLFRDDRLSLNLEGYGDYYQNVKSAELTTDNWQDFFELKVSYYLIKDDWGDFKEFDYAAFLVPKEGVRIYGITDGRMQAEVHDTARGMIHFNTGTEEYTITELTPEGEEYSKNYMGADAVSVDRGFDKRLSVNSHLLFEEYGLYIQLYSVHKDFVTLEENMLTAPVRTEFDIEVQRIKGTLFYGEKE